MQQQVTAVAATLPQGYKPTVYNADNNTGFGVVVIGWPHNINSTYSTSKSQQPLLEDKRHVHPYLHVKYFPVLACMAW